jgi:hypothetical protein
MKRPKVAAAAASFWKSKKNVETTGERKVARRGEVGRKTFATLVVVRTLVRWLVA